ncbi:hypothetical protein GW17_00019173 [Ensete ventricosum]|nr:hypothetical protein GW17_00019173 [Ensete ventricosum]
MCHIENQGLTYQSIPAYQDYLGMKNRPKARTAWSPRTGGDNARKGGMYPLLLSSPPLLLIPFFSLDFGGTAL